MILRAFFYVSIVAFITGCSSGEGDSQLVNSPQYNMLMADDMTSAIWSVNILELLDNSTIDELDLGMAGMVVQGLLTKMIDTAEGGIDFSSNSYISIKHDAAFNFNYSFTNYPVTNRSKVFKTLKSTIGFVASGNESIYEGFDAYTSNTGTAALWDDQHVVLVFSHPNVEKQKLLEIAKRILDSRYVDARANKHMDDFLALQDDFSCYVDLDKMAKITEIQSDGNLINSLLDTNKQGSLIARGNFSKGEMIFTIDANVDKLKESEFNVFQREGVSEDILRSVATNQSVNVWGANLKIKGLLQILSDFEFGGNNIFQVLEEFGFTGSSLEQLLTGEIAISMVDVHFDEDEEAFDFFDEDSYSSLLFGQDLKPEILVGLKLKDPNAFKNFLAESAKIKNEDKVYSINGFYIIERDGNAIITKGRELIQKIKSGELTRADHIEINEASNDFSFYGYLNTDYSEYAPSVQSMLINQFSKEGIDKLWMAEKITMAGNYNHIEFKVVMKDREINALGTFVQSLYALVLG